MKQSRLHTHHAQSGATFEAIAGWEVPAHYGDWRAEYQAVRHAVGLADISHRGKVRVTGDDRTKWLQSIISNDILPVKPGQGVYSSLLTHKGKMLSYFRVYPQVDSLLIEDVGEIGETTLQTLRKFLLYGTKAKIENLADTWGLLLLSGPKACDLIQALFQIDLAGTKPLSATSTEFEGRTLLLLRTEETGEVDVELLAPAESLPALWERLVAAGGPFGLRPIGTQAREALRMEAGLPKAGPDLNEEIVPPEANLEGKAFSLNKGCYPGQEVVARMDTYGSVRRHLVGLVLKEGVVPPHGAKLFSGDREVGWVSSATTSPQLGTVIAFGYPLRDFSKPETPLTIELDGRRVEATVQALPFYSKS